METKPYWLKTIADRTCLSDEQCQKIDEYLYWGAGSEHQNPPGVMGVHSQLLLETLMWLYGDKLDTEPKFQEILYSGLEDEPKDTSTEHIAWVERMFLAGLQALRQGQTQKAQEIWNKTKSKADPDHQVLIDVRDQIMKGVFQMNLGRYRMAIDLLHENLEKHAVKLDLYMLIHAYAACAISYSRLGRFEEAERSLGVLQALLEGKPATLTARVYRLKVLNLIQKGDFGLAREFLVSILSDNRCEGLIRAYFMQQLLGYQISRNQITDASETLEKLNEFISTSGLADTVINLHKEKSELLIRTGKSEEALEKLNRAMEVAESNGDFQDQFSFGVLKAQALTYCGREAEALELIDKTLTLGEENEYLSGLVVAYFHAAGVAHKLQDEHRFRIFSGKGQTLAKKLKMDVRAACFEYMQLVRFSGKPQVYCLLSMLNNPNFGPDVDYYLESYGVVSSKKVCLKELSGSKSELTEPEMRKRVTDARGIYVFPDEAVVVKNSVAGTEVHTLNQESVVTNAALEVLDSSPDGLGVTELFALNNKIKFNPTRHASQVKMLIHRMRAALEPTGLMVKHARSTKKYYIEADLPVFTVTWL